MSNDPMAMLKTVTTGPLVYRLRLFAIECCRAVWDTLTAAEKMALTAVESSVRSFAQGEINEFIQLRQIRRDFGTGDGWAWAVTCPDIAVGLRGTLYNALQGSFPSPKREELCHLLREVVGPSIQIITKPEWFTKEVYDLANDLANDPKSIPVLADLLEEQGCTNEMILGHLREPNHTQHCWAVDLFRRTFILGQAVF